MNDGYSKAKAQADKLREETEEKEEKALKARESAIASLQHNEELAQMYNESATLGTANLGSDLPLLKVHATGRSTTNELADGSEPNDGYFFYKPTQQQFESIDCHILTVSRGFRAPGMEGKSDIFNQVVGGVINDNGNYKPFLMYFTGKKLQNLWEFGKQAGKYTKAKPVSIPMFALTVRMSTEKVSNSVGKSWIVNFEIVKEEDGTPKLVLDPGEFQFLKDHVQPLEETIENLISVKTSSSGDEVIQEA